MTSSAASPVAVTAPRRLVDGRERVVFYQVDASLIDLETNTKVWVGQHKIKKYIERARFGL